MTVRWVLRAVALVSPHVRANLAVNRADSHRARREWAAAARGYARALRIRPERRAIWVQLGHALKENGEPDAALDAYRRACALPGGDGDAPLHRGVLAKRLGHFVEAKTALRQSCRERPDHAGARSEFLTMLHEVRAVEDHMRTIALALLAEETARIAAGNDGLAVVFDVSDLVGYFHHSRLPTGIQRVQIEVIRAAIAVHPGAQIGCFRDEAGLWVRVPAGHFERLCALSVASGDLLDPDWIDALEILTAALAQAEPVAFVPGAFLVNLGGSWWLRNYFLHLRRVQRSCAIHYVPFVHDMIPAIVPQHCLRELTQDFLGWASAVFDHADVFLVNSHSTGADLRQVAAQLGHTVPAAHVAVVPLDGDFRRPDLPHAPIGRLQQWDLNPGDFALFVATIEPRKNHILAFQAWRVLIDRHGAAAVPDLVCVGNRGWLCDHVYAALDADPVLAAKVRMLSGLPDEALALLYRHCRFTVYASSYEGWGLPVTESLCYGKVPVVCRSSALPEAGGDFAVYFDPDDVTGLVAAVAALAFDPAARAAREAHIRDAFAPRPWTDVARQIVDDLRRFAPLPQHRGRAPIVYDRLYRLRRNRRTVPARGMDQGEQWRCGTGWNPPEDPGCSTRAGGGSIGFALPDAQDTVRCWLRLQSCAGQAGVTIATRARTYSCTLPAGDWRWVSLPAPCSDGHVDVRIDAAAGVRVGGLVVTPGRDSRSLPALAQAMAGRESGPSSWVCDMAVLLWNRDPLPGELEDWLPPLESGDMTRIALIDRFATTADYYRASTQTVVFDAD